MAGNEGSLFFLVDCPWILLCGTHGQGVIIWLIINSSPGISQSQKNKAWYQSPLKRTKYQTSWHKCWWNLLFFLTCPFGAIDLYCTNFACNGERVLWIHAASREERPQNLHQWAENMQQTMSKDRKSCDCWVTDIKSYVFTWLLFLVGLTSRVSCQGTCPSSNPWALVDRSQCCFVGLGQRVTCINCISQQNSTACIDGKEWQNKKNISFIYGKK